MSNLIHIKKLILNHKRIIINTLLLLSSPFCLVILNMLCNTLFNLGIYVGTFLRFLYNFIVY